MHLYIYIYIYIYIYPPPRSARVACSGFQPQWSVLGSGLGSGLWARALGSGPGLWALGQGSGLRATVVGD